MHFLIPINLTYFSTIDSLQLSISTFDTMLDFMFQVHHFFIIPIKMLCVVSLHLFIVNDPLHSFLNQSKYITELLI